MNTALRSKRHYVDPAPFDPGTMEPVGSASESFYRASSWQLMWWKFRRHKVAVAAAFILLAFYMLVPLVEVIAPYNQTKRNGDFLYAPPQGVHLMHEGRFIGPFTYPYTYRSGTSDQSYACTKRGPPSEHSEPQRYTIFAHTGHTEPNCSSRIL